MPSWTSAGSYCSPTRCLPVAELTPRERLQPSLLDRLVDDEPDKSQEAREQRVLSLQKLRQCVLRDLSWVLNCGSLESLVDLADYSYAAHSVVNYGVRDLAGTTVAGANLAAIERRLRQAILDFEPRILPDTLKIQVAASDKHMSLNAITFTIEGDLWAQPLPLRLYIRTEIDLETGRAELFDLGG
jgi:type VI secretion system protein ImpF